PARSRDRRQIAYATMTEDSVYQLRVLPSEGGTPEVLYESKSVRLDWPSWSPDGQKIACSYYESDSSFHQIALFSLTDRRLETITSPHYDSRYPDWSPDGNRVAFYSPRASGGSIWLLSLDNKELTQLPLTRDVGTYPCWSPDGSYLAIGSPSITYIYSIADDRLTQVSSGGFISPQWLPDSKSLVGSKSSSSGYSEICIISLESLEVTPVTTPKENYSDTHPTWFPNNTDIAFYRYHEGILKTSLHGGSLVRLLSDVYQDPEISPDGKKIIFEYFSYSIGIADLDTKASLEITREYRDYMFAAFNKEVSLRDPTWSPDTTKFACCSNDSLIIFRIEGKKAVKESGFAGRFYDPSWSAEHPVFGSHLAAESGDGSIYMISPETHEINRIIEIGLDPCWSPDGTSLAYVDKNGHIYVKQVLFNLSK
ncbi:MAG: hypothetical protein ONB05_04555, partial [candidate division KSB1 bacterium]|nr:hypothetical protein [candidate division KSB1 bacterium]